MEDPVASRSSQDTARAAGAPAPNAAEALGGLIEGALAAVIARQQQQQQQQQSTPNGSRNISSSAMPPMAAQLQQQLRGMQTTNISGTSIPGLHMPMRALMPAATPAASAGTSGMAGADEDEEGAEQGSPWAGKGPQSEAKSSGKKLSSRFRGVCWNKKNKRWQSAINSGGRYLYLGSFQNEEGAARAFDKAAIKIRGRKAKLNFTYDDYTDANGDFIDDIILPDAPISKPSNKRKGLTKADITDITEQRQQQQQQLQGQELPAGQPGRSSRVVTDGDGSGGSPGGHGGMLSGQAAGLMAHLGVGGAAGLSMFSDAAFRGAAAMLQPARPEGLGLSGGNVMSAFGGPLGGVGARSARGYLQDAGLLVGIGLGQQGQQQGQGQYDPPLLFSGQQQQQAPSALNLQEVARQLPPGCSLDNVLPGNESAFGVVYKREATAHTGARGCAVWTGAALQDQGMFSSEREARQSCASALAAVLGKAGGQGSLWQQQQQQRPRMTVGGLSNMSLAEALAMAAKAAAEEAGLDTQTLNPNGGPTPSEGGDGAGPTSSAPVTGDGAAAAAAGGRSSGGPFSDGGGGAAIGESFKRRSGSHGLDSLLDAPAAKRTRMESSDDGAAAPAAGGGGGDGIVSSAPQPASAPQSGSSGVPSLALAATAALQAGPGAAAGGTGGANANTFSAMERLSNVQLGDMLRQMAQAAAARGSSVAAAAAGAMGGEGLQQPALST